MAKVTFGQLLSFVSTPLARCLGVKPVEIYLNGPRRSPFDFGQL